MNTSTTVAAVSPGSVYATGAFWERLWRSSGIGFVAFVVVAYIIYGHQPQIGSATDAVAAFYNGGRTRILIALVISGMAVLNLVWFAAALRATLAEAGQAGWAAAVTAASAMVGGLFFLLITVGAALACSIGRSGNTALVSGLNDFAWVSVAVTSFPRAMLIMAGTFGLWRAKLISNALFAAGAATLLLVLLGGTTWVSGTFWAPDGGYSRFVSPLVGLVWVLAVSRVLLTRSPATHAAW
jgi:hypothetical protein